jgi:CRISPR-associated endonuclease/helicase Cas3
MEDSGATAGMLWDRWLPAQLKAVLSLGLDGGGQEARRRIVWLAAIHDLGKATPAFAMQVPSLRARMTSQGFEFRLSESLRDRLPHSLASHYLVARWLVEIHGWDERAAITYAVVPGSHHGVPPSALDLHEVAARHELLGEGEQWTTSQTELAEYALILAAAQDDLAVWAEKPLSSSVQVLATAVVIVADWLASDQTRFPYLDPTTSEERVRIAWQKLNLIPAWRAVRTSEDSNKFYQSRFGFTADTPVRPIQKAAVEVADKLWAPGIVFIEAPMGEGKTEAALAAAEIIAARSGAGGCFIALPTMATSDAMFGRVKSWLEHLPQHVDGEQHTLFLAHGKASLNRDFGNLVRIGKLTAIDENYSEAGKRDSFPEEVVIAHEWLVGRKKGPLSNFVVGTIDQVLFAALKSRHLMLRHLALANKVVIIDEAHAFDAYMNVYLDRVLTWLGNYKVPVIVLSATLPRERRKALLIAYETGAREGRNLPLAEHSKTLSEVAASKRLLRQQISLSTQSCVNSEYDVLDHDLGYPVITASTGGVPKVTNVETSSRMQTVQVERMADDDVTLLEFLDVTLIQGGCIAIIRNTVARAHNTRCNFCRIILGKA